MICIRLFFRWGKEDIILNNTRGFSLSEVIIAMSIVMILMASILPIHQLIETEQLRLKQHHLIKLALHDELQDVIWLNLPLNTYEKTVANNKVTLSFTTEAEYVKGCAAWSNVQNKFEKVCLYGIQES